MHQFERAIADYLRRALLSEEAVESVYLFGREMRRIYDERANQSLQINLDNYNLPEKSYLVFASGFLRKDYQTALRAVTTTDQLRSRERVVR